MGIIDRRNRYLACRMAGVEPRFREWCGKGSLVSFAWSMNGARRHLQPGQKAAIAVEMLPMLEAEAAARAGGNAEAEYTEGMLRSYRCPKNWATDKADA
jgi:hypothetical protein